MPPLKKRSEAPASRLPAAATSTMAAAAAKKSSRLPGISNNPNMPSRKLGEQQQKQPAISMSAGSAALAARQASGLQQPNSIPRPAAAFASMSTSSSTASRSTNFVQPAMNPRRPTALQSNGIRSATSSVPAPNDLSQATNSNGKLRRMPTMASDAKDDVSALPQGPIQMAPYQQPSIPNRPQETRLPNAMPPKVGTMAPPPRNFSRPGALSPEKAEVPLRIHPSDLYAADAPILPHTPANAPTPSPSTRYSDSPGPFSHASTPTSMSSYSPGVLPARNQRKMTGSPSETRPTLMRRRNTPDEAPYGLGVDRLAIVREATNSGSSNAASPEQREAPNSLLNAPFDGAESQAAALNGKVRPAPAKLDTQVFQAPPELAHLNVDLQSSKLTQPIRPSRDNTPDLMSLNGPSPVVHSNLPASFHRRRTSTDTSIHSPDSSKSPMITKSPAKLTKSPKSMPTSHTIPDFPSELPSRSRLPRRDAASDMSSDGEMSESSQVSTTSRPSRFGFLSRKPKVDPNAKTAQKPVRPHQPGPVAGTGHEGYGTTRRRRGRRFSINSNDSGNERGSSLESTTRVRSRAVRKDSFNSGDESSMDEFLADRLNPRVIRGQLRAMGNHGNASNQSIAGDESSIASLKSTPQLSDVSTCGTDLAADQAAATPAQNQRLAPPTKRGFFGRRNDSSTSVNSQGVAPTATAVRPPTRRSNDPGIDGTALTKTSTNSSFTQEPVAVNASKLKKPAKKWNFFQRSAAPKAAATAVNVAKKSTEVTEVAVVVEPDSRRRSVAHYAMMDNTSGKNDIDELTQLMEEIDGMASGYVTEDAGVNNQQKHQDLLAKTRSILLPSPPSLQTGFVHTRIDSPTPSADLTDFDELSVLDEPGIASPVERYEPAQQQPSLAPEVQPFATIDQQIADADAPRPSRLPQVGRIPQVVPGKATPPRSLRSTYAHARPKPILKESQERPWWCHDTSDFERLPEYRTTESEGDGPVAQAAPVVSQSMSKKLEALSPLSIGVAQTTKTAASAPPEFIKFPAHSGPHNLPTGPLPNPPKAIVSPTSADTEDETWQEFDQYIDDVISPLSQTTNGSSALAEPFQYFGDISALANNVSKIPLDSFAANTADDKAAMRSSVHLARVTSQTSSTSGGPSYDLPSASGSISSIPGLRISDTPSQRPGVRRNESINSVIAKHASTSTRTSGRQNSMRSATGSKRSRMSAASGFAGPVPGEVESLESQANLRFAALMTSKWLSFGRVLFSPAHNEVTSNGKGDRILIVDGLGKDWSYYCALTYPDASVYNLGPGASSASPVQSPASAGSSWQSLPNHRHIHHPSIGAPFPFPRGFFTAVVFRFPTLTSEFCMRSALRECKRVLRPGGYLELSVLDMDMANMGNRARRAIRALKTRIAQSDPTINLKPASDAFMMLLGKRGFDNMQRCIVGVPVAGTVTGSPGDTSSGSSSDEGRTSAKRNGKVDFSTSITQSHDGSQPSQQRLSFSTMFGTSGETNDNDEGVTTMIARVSRWWWSSCYESMPMGGSPVDESIQSQMRSMWQEKGLLRECEKRGTSFRLLVCCAQKPMVTMRRTASV